MSTYPESFHPITQGRSPSKFIRAKELREHMTAAEHRIWLALKSERLAGLHFRRQQTILGFIVDFYCHRYRLIIELDGLIHKTTTQYDAERDTILTQQGMTILRFENSQIYTNLEAVLKTILNTALKLDKQTKAP